MKTTKIKPKNLLLFHRNKSFEKERVSNFLETLLFRRSVLNVK